MLSPETKWSKIFGVSFALVCLAMLFVFTLASFLWKLLRAPDRWVVRAFLDLMEDETHLDKITKQMKGG